MKWLMKKLDKNCNIVDIILLMATYVKIGSKG
jgi:hypothetical protein